jgi:hypothetical protein
MPQWFKHRATDDRNVTVELSRDTTLFYCISKDCRERFWVQEILLFVVHSILFDCENQAQSLHLLSSLDGITAEQCGEDIRKAHH